MKMDDCLDYLFSDVDFLVDFEGIAKEVDIFLEGVGYLIHEDVFDIGLVLVIVLDEIFFIFY